MTFHEIKTTFAEKLHNVRKQIAEADEKVRQYAADYQTAVTDFAIGGGKTAANARAYAKTALEKAKTHLSDLAEQANILETVRAERLKESFPALLQENRETIQAARDEYTNAAKELLQLRAATLLRLQELHKLEREARSVHSQTEIAAREAGVEFRDRFEMPNLCLTSQFSGVDQNLIPTSNESIEALKLGQVAKFVELYGLTGELLSEREATERLRIMKEGK